MISKQITRKQINNLVKKYLTGKGKPRGKPRGKGKNKTRGKGKTRGKSKSVTWVIGIADNSQKPSGVVKPPSVKLSRATSIKKQQATEMVRRIAILQSKLKDTKLSLKASLLHSFVFDILRKKTDFDFTTRTDDQIWAGYNAWNKDRKHKHVTTDEINLGRINDFAEFEKLKKEARLNDLIQLMKKPVELE